MHIWYADNSYCRRDKSSCCSDVFLFGGIIIQEEESKKLTEIIKEIKSRYGTHYLPIKWNLRDVEDKYTEFGKNDNYKILLRESLTWRKELFERSLSIDYTIVVAAIENFQVGKKNQKDIKNDLIRYVFSDAMMRVAYELKMKKINKSQFVLDWPESACAKPFNTEFFYAYNKGTNKDGHSYFSGPLKNIGVHDSLLFANMNHSNCLQFADLVVGASKEFLECILHKGDSNGNELAKILLPKFRGYPDKIFGRGISVSSNNRSFKLDLGRKLQYIPLLKLSA